MESPGSGDNLSALTVNNAVERKSIKFTTSYREIVVLLSSQRGRNRDLPNNVRLFNSLWRERSMLILWPFLLAILRQKSYGSKTDILHYLHNNNFHMMSCHLQ